MLCHLVLILLPTGLFSSSGVYSHQDLLDILNKQKFLYEKDMNHWKSTLESSASLIEKVWYDVIVTVLSEDCNSEVLLFNT